MAKARNAQGPAAAPPPAPSPPPAPTGGMTPTGQVLLVGAAIVGGVLVLTALQRRAQAAPGAAPGGGILDLLFGPRRAPTAPVPRLPITPPVTQVPVPTQPGITFRSGGFGGFVPLPFDKIVSGLFSIFQPQRSQVAELTSAVPVAVPVQEQWLTFREQSSPEQVEILQPDGTLEVPPDQFEAGAQWYEEGPTPFVAPEELGPIEVPIGTFEEIPLDESQWVEAPLFEVGLGPEPVAPAFEEVGFPTVSEEFFETGGFF